MDTPVTPLVTVLLPAYNAAPYIGTAIESVLGQTYSNFELLIFNDGSSDNTKEIILSYSDSRILFFDSPQNQGYVAHLNKGLTIANGDLIARMDADDIALHNRFEMQVSFLQANQDIDIVGGQVELISDWKNIYTTSNGDWDYPLTVAACRFKTLFSVPVAHPAVMMRTRSLRESHLLYDVSFVPAEDWEFWIRSIGQLQIINLPDTLLKYRVHPAQITEQRKQTEAALLKRIREKIVDTFFKQVPQLSTSAVYHILYEPDLIEDANDYLILYKWVNRQSFFSKKLFRDFLSHWYSLYFLMPGRAISFKQTVSPASIKLMGWANYKKALKTAWRRI
jgi:glycosyltransferase involved in cell wall biosynthesis